MRVSNNAYNSALIKQLQQSSQLHHTLQKQITTGQRVHDPSDDVEASGRILARQSDQRALDQYERNVGRAREIIDFSFNQLQEAQKMATRATELAVQADGLTDPQALHTYAEEVNQLIEQVALISKTKLRDEHIFGGTWTKDPPFTDIRDGTTDEIVAFSYIGTANGAEMAIGEGSRVSPYTSGTENQQLSTLVGYLVDLRDQMRTGDTAAIATTRESLDTVESTILYGMSNLGARQMRLEVQSAQNSSRTEMNERQISSDADADLAETVVRLNQAQVAYQAALQSSARALNMSLMDYV